MGYTLKIGEHVAEFDDDGEGETYISHGVVSEHHNEAPAFGEPTDGENSRWPSYTAWANFASLTGLDEMFLGGRDGNSKSLLREHPGCFPLTNWHKEQVDAAVVRLKSRFPQAIPAMSEPLVNGMAEEDATVNCHFARLIWLKYWVDWSLTNCKHPVFYNS